MQIIVCKLVHLLRAIGNKAPEPKQCLGHHEQCLSHHGGATKMLLHAGRIMKLTAILILGACLQIHAAGYGQKITLSEKDVPIEKVFKKIQQQTDYKFLYTSQLLEGTPRVTLSVRDASVQDVLDLIFKGQKLDYEVNENTIVIKPLKDIPVKGTGQLLIKDPIEVRGVITDENGAPAQNVNIVVKGTSKGTTTNFKGEFVLRGVPENAVLLISSIGYDREEIIVKNKDIISIKLKIAVGKLDAAQVIAYGKTTRRFTTGNIGTVKAAEIEQQPIQNPLLALQGRVPGVEVVQLTGLNGGAVQVRIQGRNSIENGLEPLIVIDGVPYPTQLQITDLEGTVLGGSALNYINPTDIESIDVLKDADATAIYGTRAANGAILITTKKGKIGRMRLSANLQQGWGKVTGKVDMMNTRQYLDMRYEAYKNDGIDFTDPNQTYAPDLTLWDTTRYTDWQKTLIGNTAKYTHIEASISGGTSSMQYLMSCNYNRRTTVFPGDFEDKSGGLHFNINGASANQKLKVQLSGSYMIDQNKLPFQDLTVFAIGLEPNAPALYNEDGTLNWEPNAAGSSTWQNPLNNKFYEFNNTTKNLVSNAVIGYSILPGLEVRSSFGYTSLDARIFNPLKLEFAKPESRPFAQRTVSYGNRNMNSWIIEPQVVYNKSIGKGKLEGLLGSTFQQNSYDFLSLEGKGYISDLLMNSLLNATTRTVTQNSSSMYKYNAVFGRLGYNWADKYLVNLTGRRDGSSRFGDNNKFHNFASVGIGWIFSAEEWMKKSLSFLSFGKLRGSYGTTGNDQITDYLYLSLYNNLNPAIPYQNTVGFAANRISNPYLQWEETRKLQGGIDLGFLNDRIIINATYAYNRSSNQLIEYQLPLITGFGSITQNLLATIQNTSWEFMLNTTNVKGRYFSWSSSFNLTIPRNKLVSFPNIELTAYGSKGSTVVVGQPLGLIRTLHYIGVDPATGLYQVAHEDGSPVPVTDFPNYPDDYNILINTLPKFYGGLQNNISFKGIQLDFLFQFVRQIGPKQLYYFNENIVPGQFGYGQSNQPVTLVDRWQKPGDNSNFGKYSSDGNISLWSAYSDVRYNYDASFIRLKNVSLSWQLPKEWIQKAQLQSSRFYFQGQNLATITKSTGLDPEAQGSNSLPPLQMWTLGVQIQF